MKMAENSMLYLRKKKANLNSHLEKDKSVRQIVALKNVYICCKTFVNLWPKGKVLIA